MNLILQAIKSLFSKLENKIARLENLTLNDLLRGNKIPGSDVEDMYYSVPSVLKEILSETVVDTKEELTKDGSYVRDDVPTYGCDIQDFVASDYGITEDLFGETFVVVWDGVEYECVANEWSLEMFVLGNPNIVHSRKENTGEPFCILADVYWGGTTLYIRTNDNSANHTVAFGTPIKPGKTVKMPKRFLPEHDHGVIPVEQGGTGCTTVGGIRNILGMPSYNGIGTKTVTDQVAGTSYRCLKVDGSFALLKGSIFCVFYGGYTHAFDGMSFSNKLVMFHKQLSWPKGTDAPDMRVFAYDGEVLVEVAFKGN